MDSKLDLRTNHRNSRRSQVCVNQKLYPNISDNFQSNLAISGDAYSGGASAPPSFQDAFGSSPGANSGGFTPGTAALAPTALLELSISARNLRDMDTFSKSDPMAVIFMQPFGSRDYVEVFRTECIQNNLNPRFARKAKVSYAFEEVQNIRFEVYDLDSNSPNLEDHDFIGGAATTLAQIASADITRLQLTTPTRGEGKGYLILNEQ